MFPQANCLCCKTAPYMNALTGKVKKISIMMWILAILFVLRYILL